MKIESQLRDRLVLGCLLSFAAIVRLTYFFEIKDNRLFQVPLLDCFNYHEWAARLAGGDWGWGQPYWMGPLYPHLLAIVYFFGGAGSAVPQLIQWILSLVSIVLVHRIGLRLIGPGPALLAAGLYTFYGTPVFYAGFLLMTTVLTTLFLLAVLLCLQALDNPTWRRFAGVGAVIGLAGLARGNVLFLLLIVPVVLWILPLATRQRARLAAAVVLGGCLVLLPVTIRNLVVGGDLVPLTSNGGINLLIGQQSQYGGIFGPIEKLPEVEFDPSGEIKLRAELGREVKPSEVSRIYSERAIREFFARPGQLTLHTLRKAYRFWSGYELPQIVSYNYWRQQSPSLQTHFIPYSLLSAVGLLGILFARGRTRVVLAVFVLAYFVSLLPFFPTARYRQPVAPLLAIAAAAYIWQTIRLWRSGERRRARWRIGSALVLMVAILPGWSAINRDQVIWQVHLHQASRASAVNDRQSIITEVQKAELAWPGKAETPYRLAGYLEQVNDYAGALPALEEAEVRLSNNRLIPYRIGRNLDRQQRHDEALAVFERCVILDSTWAPPHFGTGLVHRKLGDLPAAIDAMEQAVRLDPGKARYRANLASLCAESGQTGRARQMLQSLTSDYPHYITGWCNLAYLEYQAGNKTQARRALQQATGLRGATVEQQQQIERLTLLIVTDLD